MDDKKFEALLPIMTAALTDKICNAYHIDEDNAIERLYSSQLYAYLEDEKTKVWQYSIEKLFDLYQKETASGKLILSDY